MASSPSQFPDPNSWYIDSGASHHVTGNMRDLSLKFEYGGNYHLALGDGKTIPITYTGSSSLAGHLKEPSTGYLVLTLHRQNGVVERRNRIIQEKGLSLLAHVSLPFQYWEHAFHTPTHLSNRTITPYSLLQIPILRPIQSHPDYSYLKSLECLCFPYLCPYTPTKLTYRSLPCVFIGYGYLCLHQATGRVYISTHFIFDETSFAFASPSPETPTPPRPRLDSSSSFHILHSLPPIATLHVSTHTPSTSSSPSISPPLPSPSLHSPQSIDHTRPPHLINPSPSASPDDVSSPVVTSSHPQEQPLGYLRPSDSSVHEMNTRARDVTIFVLVYVDDILITGSHLSAITAFIVGLHRTFSLNDLGRLSYFLGIEVSYSADSIHLFQAKYLHDLLQCSEMLECKPISSPPHQPSTLDDVAMANPTHYMQIVGSLQDTTIARPEINYAVNRSCQHIQSPRLSHWREVKHILRYLKGTLNHGLTLAPLKSMDIVAYSDAGWVSDLADLHSQHGFVVFLGNNLKVVARSSTKVEYRAIAYATTEVTWLVQLLHEPHLHPSSTPVVLCDNLSAKFLTANPVINTRTKHIKLDYYFKVDVGELIVHHVPATDQRAVIFTKTLVSHAFSSLHFKLLVCPRSLACMGY
ncbi:LOW QUALITY PROTEIN: hypothetical protein V2J09_013092 [Rumex salicifolius]